MPKIAIEDTNWKLFVTATTVGVPAICNLADSGDVDMNRSHDEKYPPIIVAVVYSQLEPVKVLLEKEADVNTS